MADSLCEGWGNGSFGMSWGKWNRLNNPAMAFGLARSASQVRPNAIAGLLTVLFGCGKIIQS